MQMKFLPDVDNDIAIFKREGKQSLYRGGRTGKQVMVHSERSSL